MANLLFIMNRQCQKFEPVILHVSTRMVQADFAGEIEIVSETTGKPGSQHDWGEVSDGVVPQTIQRKGPIRIFCRRYKWPCGASRPKPGRGVRGDPEYVGELKQRTRACTHKLTL
jgi:hypothetical protein